MLPFSVGRALLSRSSVVCWSGRRLGFLCPKTRVVVPGWLNIRNRHDVKRGRGELFITWQSPKTKLSVREVRHTTLGEETRREEAAV
jgi:hypothetical protein